MKKVLVKQVMMRTIIRVDAKSIIEEQFKRASSFGLVKFYDHEEGVHGYRKCSGKIGFDYLAKPCKELEEFCYAADAILTAMDDKHANNIVEMQAWVRSSNGYADIPFPELLEIWGKNNAHLNIEASAKVAADYIRAGEPREFTYMDGSSSEDHAIPFAACC